MARPALTKIETPKPSVPEEVHVGDIVLYVMEDGRSIRPAIVVAIVTYEQSIETLERRRYGSIDLQVFVDGPFDNDIRGPHANSTLTDFRHNVFLADGEDGIYPINTYHRKA